MKRQTVRIIPGSGDKIDRAMKAIFSKIPPRSQLDDATGVFERLRATSNAGSPA